MNADLEKQANKLYLKKMLKKRLPLFTLLTLLFSSSLFAQETKLESGKSYILAKIDVTGKISYNEQTVTTFTGLEKGRYPKVFTWKDLLQSHIEHEKEIYKKGFEFDLNKIEQRLHIVEGILIALAQIEEVIETSDIISKALEL